MIETVQYTFLVKGSTFLSIVFSFHLRRKRPHPKRSIWGRHLSRLVCPGLREHPVVRACHLRPVDLADLSDLSGLEDLEFQLVQGLRERRNHLGHQGLPDRRVPREPLVERRLARQDPRLDRRDRPDQAGLAGLEDRAHRVVFRFQICPECQGLQHRLVGLAVRLDRDLRLDTLDMDSVTAWVLLRNYPYLAYRASPAFQVFRFYPVFRKDPAALGGQANNNCRSRPVLALVQRLSVDFASRALVLRPVRWIP